jgi:hypothetical protein
MGHGLSRFDGRRKTGIGRTIQAVSVSVSVSVSIAVSVAVAITIAVSVSVSSCTVTLGARITHGIIAIVLTSGETKREEY